MLTCLSSLQSICPLRRTSCSFHRKQNVIIRVESNLLEQQLYKYYKLYIFSVNNFKNVRLCKVLYFCRITRDIKPSQVNGQGQPKRNNVPWNLYFLIYSILLQKRNNFNSIFITQSSSLTLRLLMSYIYGAPKTSEHVSILY